MRRCSNCSCESDDFTDECPVCRRTLREPAGPSGPPRSPLQKAYAGLFIVFTLVAIAYWALFWIKNQP